MKAISTRWLALPKLIRFVIVNSLIGVVIGWLIAASLIWFNIGGFGDRFDHAENKLAVVFLLAGSFGATFGFAFLTTSVLLLPTDKDDFDKV
jgi:phage shock protein PspC (stress-responsive transcriptional regulator)